MRCVRQGGYSVIIRDYTSGPGNVEERVNDDEWPNPKTRDFDVDIKLDIERLPVLTDQAVATNYLAGEMAGV